MNELWERNEEMFENESLILRNANFICEIRKVKLQMTIENGNNVKIFVKFGVMNDKIYKEK